MAIETVYYYDDGDGVCDRFDADVFEKLVDCDEWGGKHDCTEHRGYFKDKNGDFWCIQYDVSYDYGIQSVMVRGPFDQVVEEVTIQRNKYMKKEND